MTRAAAPSDASPIEAAEASRLFARFESEPALLVAVSGGPDSVALLVLLAGWAVAPGRPRIHAATVDHGLRDASRDEARVVAHLCAGLAVPHAILDWSGPKPSAALQAAARAARYSLLSDEARRLGATSLLTAHTLDDQAETVMMRLAAGSGPAGLGAMRAVSDLGGVRLARPLLDIPKSRLIATLAARSLSHAQEPSNADPRFGRVRWRALMPALASEGLTSRRLAALSHRLARADEALDAVARRTADRLLGRKAEAAEIDLDALLEEPAEIGLRVLAMVLDRVDRGRQPRLLRLEACFAAFAEARRGGLAITRTLSGCVLHLHRDGTLSITREGVRSRGGRLAAE